jgi:hypothetical protein
MVRIWRMPMAAGTEAFARARNTSRSTASNASISRITADL